MGRQVRLCRWARHLVVRLAVTGGSLTKIENVTSLSTGRGTLTNEYLNLLAVLIDQTSTFRCIKPNNVKRSGVFTPDLVRHQVRYLGLLENVRVRRAGYAYRQTYEECLKR